MKRFYKFRLIRLILRLLESFLSFCSSDILLKEEKDETNTSENNFNSHEKEDNNHDSNSSKP